MRKPARFPRLLALLPVALLLLAPGIARAATYSSSWDGGHIAVSTGPPYTEATIESIEVSFDECGTATGETGCTWEATLTLHSNPERRCNPATPEDQQVWTSGAQTGNGTFTDGSKSFPLEGCPGQNLAILIAFHKTYDESAGPFRVTGGGSQWALLAFGVDEFEDATHLILNASPPAQIPPPPMPTALVAAPDCRSLTIGKVAYLFSFHGIGCHKASDLAAMRNLSNSAPSGYHCKDGKTNGGVLCWRIGHPEKYLEWRLPHTKSVARLRP